MAAAEPQHRVLVVNDDGYDAPGLHALVAALASLPGVAVFVAAPSAERSATGHGITIHAPLVAAPVHIPHAREAFAVTGLPADCTMMALGPLFAGQRFDCVVSGINRGNNYGLHALYSGTVAGAREAAAKGCVAVALSLDTHAAGADYPPAAAAVLPLMRALLARLRAGGAEALRGTVLNVNIPYTPHAALRGYQLCAQGYECTLPGFREVQVPAGAAAALEAISKGPLRAWRNSALNGARLDRRPGTDAAAVAEARIAVQVLTLLSCALAGGRQAAPSLPQVPEGLNDAAADAVLDAAVAAAVGAGGAAVGLHLAAAPAEDSSL